jgi:EmrB/QacA subfamily drug resistance transporter
MSHTATAPTDVQTPADVPAKMSHRQVLEALSGLLLGMFVAILASTVVSTSLPRIIGDLGGGESAYTWVVTSTLLATTVTTPVWGKFADLFNRKLLIQLSLVIFVLGSALAGFSENPGTLITFRVVQGIGAGGLTALSQIIMADIISPRERGRYMGLFGAVMAVGTVGGPLFGGFLTDGLGWRWNFFVGVPFAIAAIILLQFTLKLRKRDARKVSIDYLGAVLIAGGVSLLLIWVTLAGSQFGWASLATLLMVGGAVVALVLAVVVELRAEEPILPMTLFKNRTFTLSTIASVIVGIAMFGTSVYLAQYMQLARGATPTQSGLLTLPMIVGLLLSSTVVGSIITKTGKWKRYMVGGSIALVVGMAAMGTIAYDTPYPVVAVYMFILGAGVGMVMQNLVLVVQNTTEAKNIGSASAGVAFFRSLGGTIGVSVLGTILGSRVTTALADSQADLTRAIQSLGARGATVAKELASGSIPNVTELPGPVRVIVESAYGSGIAHVFLIAAPIALIAVVAIALLPNKELTTQTVAERAAEQPGIDPASIAPGMPAQASVTGPVATQDPQDDGRDSQRVGAGRAADS